MAGVCTDRVDDIAAVNVDSVLGAAVLVAKFPCYSVAGAILEAGSTALFTAIVRLFRCYGSIYVSPADKSAKQSGARRTCVHVRQGTLFSTYPAKSGCEPVPHRVPTP